MKVKQEFPVKKRYQLTVPWEVWLSKSVEIANINWGLMSMSIQINNTHEWMPENLIDGEINSSNA